MHFDIYCGSAPTEGDCSRIHDLMARTMQKVNKPFFAHTLVLYGPAKKQALALLSHAGCNVTVKRTKHRIKHAVVINGPAPSEFMQNRKQVLICPHDRH